MKLTRQVTGIAILIFIICAAGWISWQDEVTKFIFITSMTISLLLLFIIFVIQLLRPHDNEEED